MPHAVHVSTNIWAIAPDGTLHFTPSAAPRWRPVPGLPTTATTLTGCEHTCTVYVACIDGTLHSFHSSSATLQASSDSPLHALPHCLLSVPNENALFAGLSDGAVVRLYLPSLAFDCMLGAGVEHAAAVYALAADSHYLYSAGADAIVLVWNLPDLSGVRDYNIPTGPICSLLRVGFSLWLGLESGAVQVLDIFGDDVNRVSEVVQKSAHSRPVTALIRVGEHTVWSVEDLPTAADPAEPFVPNVAIWDLRDYSFTMAHDLYNPLIKTVAVIARAPLERVTVVALSADLNTQFVIKDVPGNLVKPSTSAQTPATPNSCQPDSSYQSLQIYVSQLEQQLLDAQEKIQQSTFTSQSLEISNTPSDKAVLSPRSKGDPLDNPGDQLGLLEESAPRVVEFNSEETVANVEDETDALALPNSIADALQTTFTRLADLLVKLLTDEVLAVDSDPTATQNDDLRRTVADLTKQLHIGRQLIGCCVTPNVESDIDANIFAAIGNVDNYDIAPKSVLEGLRQKLDDSLARSEDLEADLRAIVDERDLLRDDLQQTQAQADTTMASLEGIIREREADLSSRDATIAQLRAEVQGRGTALEAEKQERAQMEQAVADETAHLAEMARNAALEYESQLNLAYKKIDSKNSEIQSLQDARHVLEARIDDFRNENCALEGRCQKVERELADATATVESARKELAVNLAAKENQHREALQAIKLEREDELVALRRELAALREEYETHRADADAKCTSLRTEIDDTRREKKCQLATLQHETNMEVSRLETGLESAKREARDAKSSVSKLEAMNATLAIAKENELHELHDAIEQERIEFAASMKQHNEEAAAILANSRETFANERAQLETYLKKVENERDALERQMAGKDAILEKLESRCRILEREASQRVSEFNKLEASRNSLERKLWDQEVAVDKLEAEARCTTGLREETCALAGDQLDELGNTHSGTFREERDLLRKEIEHRRAASELYEAELQSMHGVIDDLRMATGELERSLESSEDEARRLQSHVDQLRAALQTRELRINQLEGRVAATISLPDGSVLIEDEPATLDTNVATIEGSGKQDETASLKAMQALLASASGEISQMSRELEAMYRAQFAREKELESLREAVCVRNDKIRRKDDTIEILRSKGACSKCGFISEEVQLDEQNLQRTPSGCDESEGNTHSERSAEPKSGNTNRIGESVMKMDGLRKEEDLIQATLQELHEGMIVTQDKLRDVRSLARHYKSLAQSHLEVLPALYEVEGELERIFGLMRKHKVGDWMTVVEQRISCVRGVVQSVIAQYYTNVQKQCVIQGSDDARYVPSAKRLAALKATVRRMRRVRVGSMGGASSQNSTPSKLTYGRIQRNLDIRRRITFD